MSMLQRSITEPIRTGMTTDELWATTESGLILCWERGRAKRTMEPSLAEQAERGELPVLVWVGGVEKKLKAMEEKPAPLYYLATWQGLRGEDLSIALDGEYRHTCTRTGQVVVFSVDWRSEQDAANR